MAWWLKGNFGLGREDCQQAETDEFLCIVAGCVLGTDVCHWIFKTNNIVQDQQDSPLRQGCQGHEMCCLV